MIEIWNYRTLTPRTYDDLQQFGSEGLGGKDGGPEGGHNGVLLVEGLRVARTGEITRKSVITIQGLIIAKAAHREIWGIPS